jgi:hypothetical protein
MVRDLATAGAVVRIIPVEQFPCHLSMSITSALCGAEIAAGGLTAAADDEDA